MGIYAQHGSKFYRYKFVIGGELFEGSTKKTTKREAQEVEAQARVAAMHKKNKAEIKDMPLSIAADLFMEEHVIKEGLKGPDDIARRIDNVLGGLGRMTMVSEVDDDKITAFVDKRLKTRAARKETNLSPATVKGELLELKRLLNWTRDAKKVPIQIIFWRKILKMKRLKTQQRKRLLSAAEQKLIISTAPEHYRPVVEFALATGFRLRSFIGLKWSDVDWENEVIQILQKGERPHSMPITAEIRSILEPLVGRHPEYVFTYQATRTVKNRGVENVKGNWYPMQAWSFAQWFREHKAKLGIQDLRVHDIRRTAGSAVLAASNMAVASKFLGHSSIKVTESVYAFVADEDVRAGVEGAGAKRSKARVEA